MQEFDATPYTYVDTPAGLRAMAERLAGARELAVDLEHHSHRSYQVRWSQHWPKSQLEAPSVWKSFLSPQTSCGLMDSVGVLMCCYFIRAKVARQHFLGFDLLRVAR